MAVPHFAWPLQLAGDGTPVTVEQDTTAEIAQQVTILLLTRRGRRADLPDYGVGDPVMRNGFDTPDAQTALARYEPRAVARITQRRGADDLALAVDVLVGAARKATT